MSKDHKTKEMRRRRRLFQAMTWPSVFCVCLPPFELSNDATWNQYRARPIVCSTSLVFVLLFACLLAPFKHGGANKTHTSLVTTTSNRQSNTIAERGPISGSSGVQEEAQASCKHSLVEGANLANLASSRESIRVAKVREGWVATNWRPCCWAHTLKLGRHDEPTFIDIGQS